MENLTGELVKKLESLLRNISQVRLLVIFFITMFLVLSTAKTIIIELIFLILHVTDTCNSAFYKQLSSASCDSY